MTRSIDAAHRGIYRDPAEVTEDDIPRADADQHTMGGALTAYVRRRIPAQLLRQACAEGAGIEIHGIYPAHVPQVFPDAVLLDGGHQFGAKRFNHVRPHCFMVPAGGNGLGPGRRTTRLVMAVPPGHDYLLHYASMVRHCLRDETQSKAGRCRVIRYLAAESSIAQWTGMSEFVEPGDRVLLGYVQELVQRMVSGGAVVSEHREGEYYGSVLICFPISGIRIRALGVRFSFWGDISARLAEACQRNGAEEIIYAGKLGTLTTPLDVYRRIFLPSAYIYCDSEAPDAIWPGPPNELLSYFPWLGSGIHMSVRTVLEENLVQRAHAARINVNSMDNEIAQMAAAVTASGGSEPATFSALHFATDYLGDPGLPDHVSYYNLANNRSPTAIGKKMRSLDDIARILLAYYNQKSRDVTYETVSSST